MSDIETRSKMLQARVSLTLWQRVHERAEQTGRKVSDFIRRLIEIHIDDEGI